MKQWHTIIFSAKLDQYDIRALNKCFYDETEKTLDISGCVGLKIIPQYPAERAKKAAADFVEAIKTIANKPENLDNLESYLAQHFQEWLKKFAYDPDCIAAEMKDFANMDI